MNIGIGSDHHGVEKKKMIKEYLENLGYVVVDFGPFDNNPVDYPVYAFKVAEAIRDNLVDLGILMCGTGIGMSIAANKVSGVRCARVCSKEDATLCREHNNANVIAFSGDMDFEKQKEIIDAFINAKNLTDERHVKRVNMIDTYNG